MSIFVGAEGFQLGNTFILTVLHLSVGDSTDYKHFVFKAPLLPFTAIERRSIRYCTRYLHQISRTEGDVPYSALVPIIKKMESSTLYCYGYTTARFLRKLLPTSIIIDTQTELRVTKCPLESPQLHASRQMRQGILLLPRQMP